MILGLADGQHEDDVLLENGKRLTELMVDRGVGVGSRRTVEFKCLAEEFFLEE